MRPTLVTDGTPTAVPWDAIAEGTVEKIRDARGEIQRHLLRTYPAGVGVAGDDVAMLLMDATATLLTAEIVLEGGRGRLMPASVLRLAVRGERA